jgi:hypothetical protein
MLVATAEDLDAALIKQKSLLCLKGGAGLTGHGDTEEEANADLEAQIEEIREEHLLRHPFQACGCIYCRVR